MNADFFEAVKLLEKERGISGEYLMEKIRNALVIAVKKDYNVEDDNVLLDIDPATAKFSVSLVQDVVEEVENPYTQLSLEEAHQRRKTYNIGDRVITPLKTKEIGRIAAQTARHVIRQGIREAERSQLYVDMQNKVHEMVTGTVVRVDEKKGTVVLNMGKGEAVLPRNEQLPGEEFAIGQIVSVYVADVSETERGPRVLISRTHSGMVKRIFENEVPEIFSGIVEVKAISREAGMRSKIAVASKDPNVDPVGACIGAHGARVGRIVEQLGGEKIDVIPWNEDPTVFIAAALSPAKVVKVEVLDEETRACRVTVPDQQLSLAIGNKGQNARLCARLTGYNIDIRPESGYYGEDEDEQPQDQQA